MRFAKYHGLGNDFLLFDEKDGVTPAEFTSERVRSLCHRQTGVGADGILLRTKSDKATHKMWLWNADGSSAEISGNGLRCFVLFLEDRGYEVAKEFEVETGGGVLKARSVGDHVIETTMPVPNFARSGAPEMLKLTSLDQTFDVLSVNVGNPHGVIFGEQRDIPFAEKYGPSLEKNPAFPQGANIEFVNVMSKDSCNLVVWERGAGITLACGSGSVATACAGCALGHFEFDKAIAVHQPGGALHITVAREFREIRQRSIAERVFEGVALG
ncbi:MAG: diaminopimelate epimerase [Calditrichaeota bacterium]|nr:diaminopimelate epimerase [Calditrichota bacterium]MCB9369946.1 diaminopimelate epimerase [Calditrichota bacterium]